MFPLIAIFLALKFSASVQQTPAQAAQTGIVSGQLLRPNGKPAAGVRIAVTPASGTGDLMSLAQTDETGRFRLENIPPGQYFIHSGSLDAPNYYPGVTTIDKATSITVSAGNVLELSGFQIPRPPGATITGKLPPNLAVFPSDIAVLPANVGIAIDRLSSTGRLGSTSRVSISNGGLIIDDPGGSASGGRMVFGMPGYNPRYTSAQINSDGTFEISGVAPGVYTLIAVPSNPLLIRTVTVDTDDIELPTATDARWKVKGAVGLSESSRVSGQRLILSGTMWGRLETISDASGAFEFSNVPAGTFSLKNTEGTELVTVIVRDHDIERVTVPALFVLNGRVRIATGMAFPAVRITATASDGKKTVSNIIYSDQPCCRDGFPQDLSPPGSDYRGGDESGFTISFLEGEYRITAELPSVRGVVESIMYGSVNLKVNPMIVRSPAQTFLITIGSQ
jgi:hypothetical protein